MLISVHSQPHHADLHVSQLRQAVSHTVPPSPRIFMHRRGVDHPASCRYVKIGKDIIQSNTDATHFSTAQFYTSRRQVKASVLAALQTGLAPYGAIVHDFQVCGCVWFESVVSHRSSAIPCLCFLITIPINVFVMIGYRDGCCQAGFQIGACWHFGVVFAVAVARLSRTQPCIVCATPTLVCAVVECCTASGDSDHHQHKHRAGAGMLPLCWRTVVVIHGAAITLPFSHVFITLCCVCTPAADGDHDDAERHGASDRCADGCDSGRAATADPVLFGEHDT